ncbi:uncharacterized protein LOC134528501 [Bacillus rossius redtenbacheri]|uniref:uncharacterized protein LOC134528501 n=1 Tax=Bacillus rossius redtenbacheri TaxID=93214 RepID=UPI002FDE136A
MAEAKGKSKKRLPKDAPATTFDPVSVEVKTLDTVVKLLASSERDVLLQALLALDGAAAKHPDSLSAVLELGATDPLLGLARHQDLDVRRFSMKLLAQLSRLEPARRRLLQDEALVAFFVRVLAEDDDVVAHEFSSLVLAELTADSAEAGELVMTAEGVFDALLLRTASPDPDVEHNCLQLMANLLRDPAAYEGFAGAAGFGFEPLLALLGSEYPAVQRLAARVSGALTARARDSRAHELFRRAAGVDRALDVLEKPEWEDLHQDVTQLLVHAAQDPDTAELVHRSGALRRLLDLADKSAATSSLLDGALAVVARVAALEPGRQALYGLGAHELLARLVRGGAAAACPGLALLARLPAALAALAALDPAPDLAQLLRGESRGWAERTLAAQALCELARLDRRFALALLRDGTQEGEAPCAGLAVAAMECLSAFALEGRARDWLLESGAAVAAIVRHLRHPSVPLAHAAAAALLQLTVVDHRVAAAFVRAGALQWFVGNRT